MGIWLARKRRNVAPFYDKMSLLKIRNTGPALGVMFVCLASAQQVRAQSGDANTPRVDQLFAGYARGNSPGCALAVIRNGHIIYEKGYGLANLEYSVPITPHTVFHIASVSKQFTAFAIQLLAADGKLSLDDDVHKYLPELHDFGTPITIRHLLHHTSGLRDQWSLLNMAGWRSGDIITEDDILSVVWRQRALNFTPGAEELYSNTGYTLLGLIVQRVSGQTLRRFTEERMFAPLGMRHTHFNDDNTEIVADRAASYSPRGADGFSNAPLQYSNVGATSLLTTVEDMARWDENFTDARVGGAGVVKAMLEPGTLASGKAMHYASGLVLGDYRGLAIVEHGGSDAGFRSEYLRFPDAHFSVVVLSNLGSADPGSLARRVADIYLADRLTKAETVATPREAKIDPSIYDGYTGDYLLGPDLVFTFVREGDQLWLQATGNGKMQALPASDTEFFFKGVSARLRFVPGKDGKAERVVLDEGGSERPGPRFTRARPTAVELADYAGVYYSEELGTLCDLSVRDGGLRLRYRRGVVTLEPTIKDAFVADYPIGNVQFVRDEGTKEVRGLTLTNDRARNVAFVKTHLGS